MSDQLQIWMDSWVYNHFAPEVTGYCDILLNRINPIFADLDGEGERVTQEFLSNVRPRHDDDYDGVMEAAYEHAQQHIWQFM